MKVTLNTIFGEVIEDYPETERVLKKYLGEAYCLTCPGKMFDTIGNGAMLHGLSDAETMNMLHDMQEVVNSYPADYKPERPERDEENAVADMWTLDDSEVYPWMEGAQAEEGESDAEMTEEHSADDGHGHGDDELPVDGDEDELGGSPLW